MPYCQVADFVLCGLECVGMELKTKQKIVEHLAVTFERQFTYGKFVVADITFEVLEFFYRGAFTHKCEFKVL